ncbi:MAG: esterase family protein [Deltaproteobacteria bacterium]|nr:esterase family protein [Deltaproteobacteria bacterium]
MQRILDLLAQLERARAPERRAKLEAFTRDVVFPLVEDDHAVFFYWDNEPTDAVFLQHWVFGLPSRIELRRIPHTDAFWLPLDLPKRARVEYKFEVVKAGHGRWAHDPRNPRRAFDPFGSNSVCPASSYQEPEWVQADPLSRQGLLAEHSLVSRHWGELRKYKLYTPYGARAGKKYPLLVVHDGDDFLHFGGMKVLLDNLIHRHEVAPIMVAFTSGVKRNWEYAANPQQADFLMHDLVPEIRSKHPILAGPEFLGLMGASFGGVSSLYTALRHPGTFGRLLLQSGSFAFTDIGEHERGPMWDPIVKMVNDFRAAPPKIDAHVYQSCGTFESLIYYNRSLFPVFQGVATRARFTEAPDGHNWINWRDRLREALTWLFPGPLWMYYE